MQALGTIRKIDNLRDVWKHESRDFSKWLSEEESLKLLSDAIGIEIALQERESSVGSFSVDIFALEEGTARRIVIENQLADTDHDHLGKIITYAAGKEADVVVWIVKKARDEHRQAIEWLNQRTDKDVGFFLIEIELWQIGESLPAPKFNVVERPNDWAKEIKTITGLTDTQKLQYEFWQAFVDYAFKEGEFAQAFSRRKHYPQHWYDLSIGRSDSHISLTVNTQKKFYSTGLYISDNKDLYTHFLKNKADIEQHLGTPLVWREGNKDCRILVERKGDIRKDSADWRDIFDWFCATAIEFKGAMAKFGI